MDGLNFNSRWLGAAILATSLAGCTELPFRRSALAAPPAPPPQYTAPVVAQPDEHQPPQAAPALYIPKSNPGNSVGAVTQTSMLKNEPSLVPEMPALVATGPPKEITPPAAADSPLRALQRNVNDHYARIDSYVMRMRRREFYNGENHPEEVLLFKFRKDPWSVYLKWLGPEGKGREVVYAKDRYEGKIHTRLAAGDFPLLPAGTRFPVAPDSTLVRSKSRYPISEAGLGSVIERFGKLVEAVEKGDASQGSAKYLGPVKRPEFDAPVIAVLQQLPTKSDSTMPKGGQRLWYFDAQLYMPVLIIANDETGREVEYYCHDRFQFNTRFEDDDFNPDKLFAGGS